jgi:hypothetical protein
MTVTLLALLTLLLSVSGTMAQDPRVLSGGLSVEGTVNSRISYQGVLKEDGSPVTGNRDMVFRLYSDGACTTQVGSDISMPGVPVSEGLFSVALDVAHDDFDGQGLRLEVEVGGTPVVCQEIMPVPYALSLRPGASIHNTAGDALSLALVLENDNGYGLRVQHAGSVGVHVSSAGSAGVFVEGAGADGLTVEQADGHGLSVVDAGLDGVNVFMANGYGVNAQGSAGGVRGHAYSASGAIHGVSGQTDSPDGYGVYGTNTAGGYAGYFDGSVNIEGVRAGSSMLTVQNSSSANDSKAIRGYASAATGFTAGVNGRTDSSTAGAKGVWGYAAGGGQTYGVHGESDSGSGRGVFGRANASSGTTFGVYGQSNSTSGRGVYGIATSTSGETYGVYGVTDSVDEGACGVYGEASDDDSDGPRKYGVYGHAAFDDELKLRSPVGVHGQADTPGGVGVKGYAYGSVDAVGVLGYTEYQDQAGNYAGLFNGILKTTGTLYKSGGSFLIDHPLDPANKYLYHSFVESPDMMNVYNGNVVLGADGRAWVDLPDYFEALNRDFRYQLTCIGGFAPVYVAHEIQSNRFQIAGGEPGLKVSWQVTGVRQDPWANANRIPVEEEKPADEQGYYLHPEVYGQPESMGVEALRGWQP